MPRITAFDGYLVNPARAGEVVSPAYDAVSPEERRRFAEAHPGNYLNTMRLQEDFAAHEQPDADELLAINKARLDELLGNGSFEEIGQPAMFIYRLVAGDHSQTGVVCEVSVDDYADGRLRIHENTLSDKEDLLASYLRVVGVSSSPICMTYPHNGEIDALLAQQTRLTPVIDFVSADGVSQTVWKVTQAAILEKLQTLFDQVDVTYLTDGHHRAASGWRYAQQMRDEHGNDKDASWNHLLVALFSTAQLNVLPFHRCVRDLNGQTEEELVRALETDFRIEALSDVDVFEPAGHGEFGMLVNEHWYRLNVRPGVIDNTDPVASLDVSVLQNRILDPVLGIRDSRRDPRLGYFSGAADNGGLRNRCREGWAVCFACYATSIRQLMNVADAGGLMPPKSTYFDPKARSGIFVRRR